MKGRSFMVLLRHCVVEVMTFVVFTISGVKGGFKIFVSITMAALFRSDMRSLRSSFN